MRDELRRGIDHALAALAENPDLTNAEVLALTFGPPALCPRAQRQAKAPADVQVGSRTGFRMARGGRRTAWAFRSGVEAGTSRGAL
ncbi:MAG: hypothetical protein AAFU51_10375 [Bacteroidota bacterium]